jgi:hypothetical protein
VTSSCPGLELGEPAFAMAREEPARLNQRAASQCRGGAARFCASATGVLARLHVLCAAGGAN